MARKTNKTAHVLNLLAAGTADENEQKETDSSSLSPNISIVDNPTSSADPLAGLIRNTLNKEILHEDEFGAEDATEDVPDDAPEDDAEEEPEEEKQEPELEQEPDVIPKAKATKTASKTAKKTKTGEAAEPNEELTPDESTPPARKKKSAAKSKAGKTDEAEEQIPAASKESDIPEPESGTADPVPDIPETEAEINPPAENAPEVSEAPPEVPFPEPEAVETPAVVPKEYVYLNMMEILVDERLMEFLNKFGACTCHRCILDAKALALSNLPPKYLVIPDSSTAPLTSFYRNKYSIYIVTELTKACLAIINNPRH